MSEDEIVNGETVAEPELVRYTVDIEYWPDEGREPTADDVFLAIQDNCGKGGRLEGVGMWSINVEPVA